VALGAVAPATAPEAASSLEPATTQSEHSDHDLVAGLVFQIGPVADELALAGAKPANLSAEEYLHLVDASVTDLLEHYDATVDPALTLIRSGDPVRAEQGLNLLGDAAIQQSQDLLSIGGIDWKPGDDEAISPKCGAAVVCAAYITVGVHNNVVGTAFVVLVAGAAVSAGAVLWTGKWVWMKSATGGGVEPKTLIADITRVA
jgi:hypothetical protein